MIKSRIPGVVILIAGLLFILAGIYRNEPATVEQKSNAICLECIGIG